MNPGAICSLSKTRNTKYGSCITFGNPQVIVNYRSFTQKLKTHTLNGIRALQIPDLCVPLWVHPQVHSCPPLDLIMSLYSLA